MYSPYQEWLFENERAEQLAKTLEEVEAEVWNKHCYDDVED
jgi:hypothetical protein